MSETAIPALPELDRECGICEGHGVVTNPEWQEWHTRATAAREAYERDRPASQSWYATEEGQRIDGAQPELAELTCRDCAGTGFILTANGSALVMFMIRHGFRFGEMG